LIHTFIYPEWKREKNQGKYINKCNKFFLLMKNCCLLCSLFLFTDGDQQNNAILRGSNFIQSQCDINFNFHFVYFESVRIKLFYCRKFIHFSQKLCNKFFKLLVFKLVLLSLELMGFHCVPFGFLIFFLQTFDDNDFQLFSFLMLPIEVWRNQSLRCWIYGVDK